MQIINYTKKRFEDDITSSLLFPAGGYTHNADVYDARPGLFPDTLIRFVQRTQPKAWVRFESANQMDAARKFC